MDLGSRIQTLRKKAGLSQEALADSLGVSRQALSKWESGASLPTLDNLLQLAKLFEISLDELITGEAPPSAGEDAPDAAVRQEALETLLRHMESGRKKTGIWLTVLCALFAVAALGAAVIAGVRTIGITQELQNLRQRIEGQNTSIQSLYHMVTDETPVIPLHEHPNIHFDYTLTGYHKDTNTLDIALTLLPQEYHKDDQLEFLLSPIRDYNFKDPADIDTLPEAIVVPAILMDERYYAEAEIPAVESMTIFLRRTDKDGNVTQEIAGYGNNMASQWIPNLTAENHSFTFRRGEGKLTMWGVPAVHVHLPTADPQGWNATLTRTLRHGDQIIFEEVHDLMEWRQEVEKALENSGSEYPTEVASGGNPTYYGSDEAYCDKEFEWIEGERLVWTFRLEFENGEILEEELSYRT